ncbi:MAG: mechanosensitive ion channel family protein [Alphaproteobacteria bacterium]|nr:mechanosensitive ion channel family protein [Alphaproteobacteria bacterium]
MQNSRDTHQETGPEEPKKGTGFGPVGLIWPIALALIFIVAALDAGSVALALDLEPDGPEAAWLAKGLTALFWLAAAFAVQRWLRVLLWTGIVEARSGVPAPGLLIDMTAALIYIAALIIVLSFVFDLPVTGLLTTSSIVIAVIGFALRNMISDLFTGIALGVERPFSIGDWVELNDGTVGRVTTMNWRATRLLTKEETTVIISNSELATGRFKNYSTPERFFRDEIEIQLDYTVTAWRAERLLKSAIWSVPEVVEVPRESEIRIKEFTESGTVWQVRFWIPDYGSLHRLRYEVQRAILRNMHFSGVHVPAQRIEWRSLPREVPQRDIDFLHAIDLLAPLTDEEVMVINDQMTQHLFKRGVPVVSQGEAGHSLFVVKEGMLSVFVAGADGRETRVGSLTPGAFFGELSLLTGAPRGATVVPEVDSIGFEITKDTLAPILQRRPELAEHLSETLAERQMRTREAFAALDAETGIERRASLTEEFLKGIKKFFGI